MGIVIGLAMGGETSGVVWISGIYMSMEIPVIVVYKVKNIIISLQFCVLFTFLFMLYYFVC